MNVAMQLIGGIPLCHGAGVLSAQYLFGARTGGDILTGVSWNSVWVYFFQKVC